MDRNKYNIVVAAGPEGDDKDGLLAFLEKRGINTKHLKYLRRSVNPLFDFLGMIEIYQLIKKEKPDILFLCSSKAGAMGSLAGHLAKVSKIIYRIGGWAFNDPRPFWQKALYKFIEKSSARWKDIIIVNAECHRKQAVEVGIKPKSRIITVYNGIDVSGLKSLSKSEAIRNLSRLKPGFNHFHHLIVGTIANLYPAKGLEYLVGAANLLRNKNIKFVVIGEGGEREKLENLIKKYKLENNFFLLGAISDAYKYLKAFDVFVLSSVKEGFPWVILEVMAAKVPIIATKVGAVPEILEEGKSGILIEPRNSQKLSEAIIKLTKNNSLRDYLIYNARKLVEEKFTLKKMGQEIEKIL